MILSLILGYSLENLLLKIKITLNVKDCFLGWIQERRNLRQLHEAIVSACESLYQQISDPKPAKRF